MTELATQEQPSTEAVASLAYDAEQLQAIELSCKLETRFWPVTGPAGTGKTTLIRDIYLHFKKAGITVVLAAPTGKAAKRIQEATGIPAMTIHRLLEYTHPGERDPKTGKHYGTSEPRRHAGNRLEYQVVLVDEYAMVNHELHANLIAAIPPGGVVRVFGDINQLQPIEKQTVFRDKPSPFEYALTKFTGTRLKTIHRQGEGSGIVVNAKMILEKRFPASRPDFKMLMTDKPLKALEALVLGDDAADYQSMKNQIITPMNKSFIGTHALNALLQRWFYPDAVANGYYVDRHDWEKQFPLYLLPGNKVINVENNYDLELYNGEGGIVKEITDAGEIVIDDGTRQVVIPPIQEYERAIGSNPDGSPKTKLLTFNPQKNLQLAYAITTHKSQGSEFDNVTYILNKSVQAMCCRPNIYTAVTRARSHVNLVADQKALYASVANEKSFFDRKKAE